MAKEQRVFVSFITNSHSDSNLYISETQGLDPTTAEGLQEVKDSAFAEVKMSGLAYEFFADRDIGIGNWAVPKGATTTDQLVGLIGPKDGNGNDQTDSFSVYATKVGTGYMRIVTFTGSEDALREWMAEPFVSDDFAPSRNWPKGIFQSSNNETGFVLTAKAAEAGFAMFDFNHPGEGPDGGGRLDWHAHYAGEIMTVDCHLSAMGSRSLDIKTNFDKDSFFKPGVVAYSEEPIMGCGPGVDICLWIEEHGSWPNTYILNCNSSADIHGYQFNHANVWDSVTALDEQGFHLTGSDTTALAFSFTSGFIPAGDTALLYFVAKGGEAYLNSLTPALLQAEMSNFIFTGEGGKSLKAEWSELIPSPTGEYITAQPSVDDDLDDRNEEIGPQVYGLHFITVSGSGAGWEELRCEKVFEEGPERILLWGKAPSAGPGYRGAQTAHEDYSINFAYNGEFKISSKQNNRYGNKKIFVFAGQTSKVLEAVSAARTASKESPSAGGVDAAVAALKGFNSFVEVIDLGWENHVQGIWQDTLKVEILKSGSYRVLRQTSNPGVYSMVADGVFDPSLVELSYQGDINMKNENEKVEELKNFYGEDCFETPKVIAAKETWIASYGIYTQAYAALEGFSEVDEESGEEQVVVEGARPKYFRVEETANVAGLAKIALTHAEQDLKMASALLKLAEGTHAANPSAETQKQVEDSTLAVTDANAHVAQAVAAKAQADKDLEDCGSLKAARKALNEASNAEATAFSKQASDYQKMLDKLSDCRSKDCGEPVEQIIQMKRGSRRPKRGELKPGEIAYTIYTRPFTEEDTETPGFKPTVETRLWVGGHAGYVPLTDEEGGEILDDAGNPVVVLQAVEAEMLWSNGDDDTEGSMDQTRADAQRALELESINIREVIEDLRSNTDPAKIDSLFEAIEELDKLSDGQTSLNTMVLQEVARVNAAMLRIVQEGRAERDRIREDLAQDVECLQLNLTTLDGGVFGNYTIPQLKSEGPPGGEPSKN